MTTRTRTSGDELWIYLEMCQWMRSVCHGFERSSRVLYFKHGYERSICLLESSLYPSCPPWLNLKVNVRSSVAARCTTRRSMRPLIFKLLCMTDIIGYSTAESSNFVYQYLDGRYIERPYHYYHIISDPITSSSFHTLGYINGKRLDA